MFRIISSSHIKQFTIKKSKFIVLTYLVKNKDEVTIKIKELKKEYSDANHICYGYILDDKTFYYSDGGEPSGCAGIPIYNAIKNNELNYCLVVAIRYFGGIKFGTGPLRTTFNDVACHTLKECKIVNASIKDVIKVAIPLSEAKKYINSFSILVIDKQYDNEKLILALAGSKEELVSRLFGTNIKILSIKEKQIIKNN